MTDKSLEALEQTTFAEISISERGDLQRLLKKQIEIISPGTLIIAEEFSDWEDSRRRIDLLGIDKSANLVVIELKRTEDGGHMELQALRYAAMVSTLNFEQVVRMFHAYLLNESDTRDAEETILRHLGWSDVEEAEFAQDVRIVLASAEFSKELTSTVIWLNERDLNIRCVRIKPYGNRNDLLLDVQQVIPLPEAQDYQFRLNEKHQKERESRKSSRDMSRFDVTIRENVHHDLPKRRAVFTVIRGVCSSGVSPAQVCTVLSWRKKLFFSVAGTVDSAGFETLARQQSEQFDPIRWFYEDSELIYADGNTYALTNQWGPRGEEAMQQVINHFRSAGVSFERKS